MQSKRIKVTKQKNLTSQQEEERQASNLQFYNGDITSKFFDQQKDIKMFLISICRKMGFTPCATNKKTGDFIQYCCEFFGWPSPSAKFSKKSDVPFMLIFLKLKRLPHIFFRHSA